MVEAGICRVLTSDYFYPAMLGVWFSEQQGRLVVVPLRETLARQWKER